MENYTIKAITSAISTVQRNQKIDSIHRVLQYFFKKDLFFFGSFCHTDSETIDFLCTQMLRGGYVDENFRASIYEREAISRSAYDTIAIPHLLNSNPDHSAISVFINPDGINWSGQTVYAVFMLSISQDEVEMFSNMFDIIHQLTGEPRQFSRLLETTQYKDFIDLVTRAMDQ